MQWQDEKLNEIFSEETEVEYVEIGGQRFIFDSKACDRWNTICWWVCTILFIVMVTKAY